MVMLEEQTQAAPPAGAGPPKERAGPRVVSPVAPHFRLDHPLLRPGLHHSWKRQAVGFLSPNDFRVLDVGAGTADLALQTAERLGNGARIVAADLNRPMLAIGVEKVRKAILQRQIVCVQANAERLCVSDSAFDAVTTGFCMRNVADLAQALQEIRRVLKPGGRLICLEFSRPVAGWLSRLYDWDSFTLLPWIGTKVSGDTTGVYQYLPASIRSFPDQDGLARLLRGVGFQKGE